MKLSRLALPILTASLTLGAGAVLAQGYPQQQPGYPQQQPGYPQQQQQPGYPQQQQGYPQQQQPYGDRDHDRDRDRDRDRYQWDAPPEDLRSDVQRQGFQDGLSSARQDFDSQRQPNAAGRPEYRHPPVPKRVRNDYRQGFQRGYDVAVRHQFEHRDRDDHDRDRDRDHGGYQPH